MTALKKILSFCILSFVFILFQVPVTSAQDDDPSGSESTDTSAWYLTDDITYPEDTSHRPPAKPEA